MPRLLTTCVTRVGPLVLLSWAIAFVLILTSAMSNFQLPKTLMRVCIFLIPQIMAGKVLIHCTLLLVLFPVVVKLPMILILPVSRGLRKPTPAPGVGRLGPPSWGIAFVAIWLLLGSSPLAFKLGTWRLIRRGPHDGSVAVRMHIFQLPGAFAEQIK